MKILYSIQATGNGHISRAMELLPYLNEYGKVDLFLSGANSSLPLDAPVQYRSKGLSLFYTCQGGLNYKKIIGSLSPARIWQEVRDLPVEKYDLVLNDFECITSLACAHKKIPSIHFGHQASFLSDNTPRPEKRNRVGEWILKNYARGSQPLGLHFKCYDDFILTPVIKSAIIEAEPANKGHITVYLPSYCDEELKQALKPLKDWHFEVFSSKTKVRYTEGNATLIPVNKHSFNNSLINCYGIITGGGFETPAEALYLKKKLMVMPIRGQYEQVCNAAALSELGVPVLRKIDDDFGRKVATWADDPQVPDLAFPYSNENIVHTLMMRCTNLKDHLYIPYPELIFN